MTNDPRLIIAKFQSKCAESGKIIKRGAECLYYPLQRQVFHLESAQAEDYRKWKFDSDYLNHQY